MKEDYNTIYFTKNFSSFVHLDSFLITLFFNFSVHKRHVISYFLFCLSLIYITLIYFSHSHFSCWWFTIPEGATILSAKLLRPMPSLPFHWNYYGTSLRNGAASMRLVVASSILAWTPRTPGSPPIYSLSPEDFWWSYTVDPSKTESSFDSSLSLNSHLGSTAQFQLQNDLAPLTKPSVPSAPTPRWRPIYRVSNPTYAHNSDPAGLKEEVLWGGTSSRTGTRRDSPGAWEAPSSASHGCREKAQLQDLRRAAPDPGYFWHPPRHPGASQIPESAPDPARHPSALGSISPQPRWRGSSSARRPSPMTDCDFASSNPLRRCLRGAAC
ncbi:uncharacterized protein ACOB8E_013524 [Sarcophilus harrisii]